MSRERDPLDPKGLIRESYRIEGITEGECRSVFLDWALSLPEGQEHPRTRHRRMMVDLGTGQRGLGVSVKLSSVPGQAHAPAPRIGQHTREVLGALGYAESEIDALVEARLAVHPPGSYPPARPAESS